MMAICPLWYANGSIQCLQKMILQPNGMLLNRLLYFVVTCVTRLQMIGLALDALQPLHLSQHALLRSLAGFLLPLMFRSLLGMQMIWS